MLADRVRIGRNKEGIEYIGEVYLAQDSDFMKFDNSWVYMGSELEIEIPHIIRGEEITSYEDMFYGMAGLPKPPVTRVDSNNKMVTNMSSTFRDSNATTLDLSNFDTSNVTNMSYMFYGSRATTLDLSSFDTSNVTNMSYMFYGSSATTGYARTQADADRFNASSNKPSNVNFVVHPDLVPYATDADFGGTTDGSFHYIGTDTTVKIPHIIKGVPVTSYANMFNTDNGRLVEKVISYNTNVTDMFGMFEYSQATELDLSSFDTSSVTSMSYMFSFSQAISLDLSSFDTSSVTSMWGMFAFNQAAELGLSSFDTSSVTDMNDMFWGSQATELDLSSFDTSNFPDMTSMFEDSQATTVFARTEADADRFNNSSNKPSTLVFVVK